MSRLFAHPFLARGFRPFFFFGSLYSALCLLVWGGFYAGVIVPGPSFLDPVSWHAHEMIFGFTIAIVAGFLLTAVANWTGGAPARQLHLALLCMLWMVARLVVNIDMGLPSWLTMLLTTAFIPALAISLSIPLIRSWSKRNFIFLTLLTVLFAADLCFLLTLSRTPLYVALMMILTMVSLIGGRIIPSFTVAALRRKGVMAFQTDQPRTDFIALITLIATTLALTFAPNTIWLSGAAGAAAAIHALRMRHYHTLPAMRDPMLWILHVGYSWLVLGLLMLALTGLGVTAIASVIHALTAGCIGSMCLGMMCRVTLGHTGRQQHASKLTVIAFSLVQAAALFRVFGPMVLPNQMSTLIIVSAALWSAAYGLYFIGYAPMLVSQRVDNQEA
jgi:uncharacterized protein involved in response to NO